MERPGQKEARFPIFQERFRELQGEMSNTEFADFLGMSRQTVGFYLNGNRVPDILGLEQISRKCNVSADWLIGISDIKSVNPDIKAICQYTGLAENTIKLLHTGKTGLDFSATKEFIDTLITIPSGKIFEENLRKATMAYMAYKRVPPEEGGGLRLEELRELPYEDYMNRMKELTEADAERDHQMVEDLINGNCIKIGFSDAEDFFKSRAVAFLEGVVYLCVDNIAEKVTFN